MYNSEMTASSPDNAIALGEELLQLIGRLNRWSSHHADTRLPLQQARLLSWIEERGAARISNLARADNCTQPGMTVQVQRLEADGLVQRNPDPNDARAVLISLTEPGRKLLYEVRRARAQAVAPVIAQLDDSAREQLQGALSSLSHLLKIAADQPIAAPTSET